MVAKRREEIIDKFEILVTLLNEVKSTDGEADGRGVAIAITHLQTAQLWFEDATALEEKATS